MSGAASIRSRRWVTLAYSPPFPSFKLNERRLILIEEVRHRECVRCNYVKLLAAFRWIETCFTLVCRPSRPGQRVTHKRVKQEALQSAA
jgi:hypothetical protein